MATQIFNEINELPNSKRVTKSAIEFDSKDEIFLLYSAGRENGPGINRDGMSSPWMIHPSPKYVGKKVTDPDLQRFGTNFIDAETKAKDLTNLASKIAKEKAKTTVDNELIADLEELLKINQHQPTYVEEFEKAYSDYEIVGIQGIGDLTMNGWNVAFINTEITTSPKLLHLLDEPIHSRIYSCLVKWKDKSLSIADLQFNRFAYNANPNDAAVVRDSDGKEVADKIEFAVYGQQLVRPTNDGSGNSEVFRRRDLVHQFSDMRHLLQMPNLNPNDGDRPRVFFGKEQKDDVWLGEAELIDSRNLRKAAIADSVELNTLYSGLGVSEAKVREAFMASDYHENKDQSARLVYDEMPVHDDPNLRTCAEWRMVPEDSRLVEVHLRENRYPCTLVGIKDNGQLVFLAWNGIYSKSPGWTLRQAAFKFKSYACSGILCDEGGDVFQYAKLNSDMKYRAIIPPGRGQIRSVFIVARKKKVN